MTCTEDFGKFTTKIKHQTCIGYREREVDLSITWVSCGVYSFQYWRPQDADDPEVIGTDKEWYPGNIHFSITPEQFDKVAELYPAAPRHERAECYKPFYEQYDLDRGMFDMGCDTLFQAFKDPREEVDRVYMVNRSFIYGQPSQDSSMLALYWNEFLRLKEYIDSKRGEIFYSGCRFSSKGVEAAWVTDKPPPLKERTSFE